MDTPVRILVVEDEDDTNRLLYDIISKNGYEAQPAFSGTAEA